MEAPGVALARIDDAQKRQQVFEQRKRELIKQAMELSILCDCDVQVFVHSARVAERPRGPSTQFSSNDAEVLAAHVREHPPAERFSTADYEATFAQASSPAVLGSPVALTRVHVRGCPDCCCHGTPWGHCVGTYSDIFACSGEWYATTGRWGNWIAAPATSPRCLKHAQSTCAIFVPVVRVTLYTRSVAGAAFACTGARLGGQV